MQLNKHAQVCENGKHDEIFIDTVISVTHVMYVSLAIKSGSNFCKSEAMNELQKIKVNPCTSKDRVITFLF